MTLSTDSLCDYLSDDHHSVTTGALLLGDLFQNALLLGGILQKFLNFFLQTAFITRFIPEISMYRTTVFCKFFFFSFLKASLLISLYFNEHLQPGVKSEKETL